jgi:hypothetical protein
MAQAFRSNEALVSQSRIVGLLLGGAVALALAGSCARGDTIGPLELTGAGGAAPVGAGGTGGVVSGPTTNVSSGAMVTSSTGTPGGSTTSATVSAGSTSSSGGTGGSDAGGGDGGHFDAGSDGATSPPSDAGSGTVVYSDDFESDTLAMQASGWMRVGGSSGDWVVVVDTTQVFAQNHAMSTTLRVCYAGSALTTPATASAKVKITASGSSGTPSAMVCVRYPAGGTPYACLALEAQVGAQIKTGGTDGPVWPTTVSVGTWYDVKLTVDASGALTAYLDGTRLGAFAPSPAIPSGSVAVATQSAEAEFDDVVLTTP